MRYIALGLPPGTSIALRTMLGNRYENQGFADAFKRPLAKRLKNSLKSK
jgi:hypothetical protein